jgi:hypothetical protein
MKHNPQCCHYPFPSRGKVGMGARTILVMVFALAPTLIRPRKGRKQKFKI